MLIVLPQYKLGCCFVTMKDTGYITLQLRQKKSQWTGFARNVLQEIESISNRKWGHGVCLKNMWGIILINYPWWETMKDKRIANIIQRSMYYSWRQYWGVRNMLGMEILYYGSFIKYILFQEAL